MNLTESVSPLWETIRKLPANGGKEWELVEMCHAEDDSQVPDADKRSVFGWNPAFGIRHIASSFQAGSDAGASGKEWIAAAMLSRGFASEHHSNFIASFTDIASLAKSLASRNLVLYCNSGEGTYR